MFLFVEKQYVVFIRRKTFKLLLEILQNLVMKTVIKTRLNCTNNFWMKKNGNRYFTYVELVFF